MPRVAGSKVIDGKVVMPGEFSENQKVENILENMGLIIPTREDAPAREPLNVDKMVKAKIAHTPIGIRVILWRGNSSKEVLVPIEALTRLSPPRLAEEAMAIMLAGINTL